MIINLHLPTRVVFGRGRLSEIGPTAAGLGHSAIIVCGRTSARRHGLLDRVRLALTGPGRTVLIHDDISPDPRSDEIDRAVTRAEQAGCDLVVGLGGGSAIDAAKAVAAGLRHGPVGPLVGTTLPDDPLLPVLAVPTTAGSGAEATKGAIVTDVERVLKSGIRGTVLFPHTAIIDPEVLATVPPHVAAESGFDALSHAVEGYVARRANPITRTQALHALELIGDRLPRLVTGDTSDAVLDDLALASLLGGLNIATASSCLPHRIQQAMGSVPTVRVSHGRGLAALYPTWLRHVRPYTGTAFDVLGSCLQADDLLTAVERLLPTIGIPAGLAAAGFTERDVGILIAGVTGDTGNDPIPDVDDTVVRRLIEGALRPHRP